MRVDNVYIPKFHIVFHLVHRMGWFGNPRLYATWLDESLNRMLKGCCRQTSQATFCRSVLFRMSRLLESKKRLRAE
jgi:hypothetical protein